MVPELFVLTEEQALLVVGTQMAEVVEVAEYILVMTSAAQSRLMEVAASSTAEQEQ
jgi:hypothetical protein